MAAESAQTHYKNEFQNKTKKNREILYNSFRVSDETWNDPIYNDSWMWHKSGHLGLRGLVRLSEQMQTL